MGNFLMNKAKKALIATSLAGALVASAGFGTYSWFTAEKATSGTITNGTLTLSDWDGRLFDQAKFAPSQLKMGNWVSITNTGNLDQVIKLSYDEKLNMGGKSLSAYTYQGFAIRVPANVTLPDNVKAYYEAFVKGSLGGGNTPLAAAAADNTAPALPDGVEVVQIDGSQAQDTASANAQASKTADPAATGPSSNRHYEVDPFTQFSAGEKIYIIMGVKLDQMAGNEYQAAVYDGALKFNGKQTDAGALYINK
jgi:spore coat-associated protein N